MVRVRVRVRVRYISVRILDASQQSLMGWDG